MTVDKEIFEFMLQELGGQEKVLKSMAMTKVYDAGDVTLGELHAIAVTEGWVDHLMAMKVDQLGKPNGNGASKAKQRRVPVETVMGEIMEVATGGESHCRRDFEVATGREQGQVSRAVGRLVKAGQLVRHGDKKSAYYSLP